jgi:hypothetical protein
MKVITPAEGAPATDLPGNSVTSFLKMVGDGIPAFRR